MLTEPVSGFAASFEELVRTPKARVNVASHYMLTTSTQNGYVTVNSSNTWAQKIVISEEIELDAIDFFVSRVSVASESVNVRLLGDDTGLPDAGDVIASGFLARLRNRRPRWYRLSLKTQPTLSAGTYWVELSADGDTEFLWHANSDVTGSGYCLNATTVTSDAALVMKILSSDTDLNTYTLPSIEGLQVNITDKFDSDSGSITISNLDGLYDEGQPIRAIIKSGELLKIQIGNGSNWITKTTMIIDEGSQTIGKQFSVNLLGKKTRLLTQSVQMKASYVGQDFSDVVYDLLNQISATFQPIGFLDSGFDLDDGVFLDSGDVNIQATGLTFPAFGTLEGSISEAIEKICDATGFIFYYDQDGTPNFVARPLSYTPVFTLSESKHILHSELNINESKMAMANRIRVDNDQTSNGAPVDAAGATLLSNKSGTLDASTPSTLIYVPYDSPPIVLASVVNEFPVNTRVIEIARYASAITLFVQNLKYPNEAVDYSVNVYGSAVTNNDAGLLIDERSSGNFLQEDGIRDLVVTNNLFSDQATLSGYLDRLIVFNGYPRDFCSVGTIGVPVLEVRDMIAIDHDNVRDDFIFRIVSESISFRNGPCQLRISYDIERLPFLQGGENTPFSFYLDSGESLDSGLFLDPGILAANQFYI